MKRVIAFSTAAMVALVSTAAFAHPGVGGHALGFAAGFAHPFGGLDHLLAMTGLGLWAAGYSGRARVVLPVAFIVGMIAGGALAVFGVGLPGVELGIAGSVVAIGLLIALGARLPVIAAGAIAFTAAVFHGHAHGSEMAGFGAALGVISATALLHAAGLGLGIAASHPRFARLVRIGGGMVAAAGVGLLAVG